MFSSLTRWRKKQNTLWWSFLGLCLTFSSGQLVIGLQNGPGVSNDSVNYFAASQSFVAGEKLAQFDGAPFTLWPPGYPIVLGSMQFLGLGVEIAVVVLNLVSNAVTILCFYFVIRRLSLNPALQATGLALFCSSTSQYLVFRMMWSEPLFIALVWVFLAIFTFGSRTSLVKVLPALTAVAAMASLIRFSGVSLFAATLGVIAFLAWRKLLPVRQAIFHLAILCVALGIIALLISASSETSGERLGGERLESPTSPSEILTQLISLSGDYALSEGTLDIFRATLGLALIGLVFRGLIINLKTSALSGLGLGLFFTFHWIIVISSKARFLMDALDFRLGAPAFGVGLILLLIALQDIKEKVPKSKSKFLRFPPQPTKIDLIQLAIISLAATVIWLNMASTIRHLHDDFSNGIGLNSVALRHSELFATIERMETPTNIFAKQPELIYWHTYKLAQSLPGGQSDWFEILPERSLWIQLSEEEARLVAQLAANEFSLRYATFPEGKIWFVSRP